MKQTYYITTPIYYPSGNWHLGHCYTTVICDAIARFKRMQGYDVFYLTGTDEHGMKIAKRAEEDGKSPQEFVDGLVASIKVLWKKLDISYDGYIRTTDAQHKTAVQKIFKTLYDKGEIYKSEYKGLYCTPCEAFWTESQLKDGKCPDCGREVKEAAEEAYFFRLSKYEGRIKELLLSGTFLEPEAAVKEMVNNFLSGNLEDLCVSRTSFSWGVPVDFDPGHVVYVWMDALSNYITALGYGSEDDSLYKKYWPADLHVVGKEIVRFHSIIWPAILIALGEPLPKKIRSHGWLLFGGDKMSKSKANVVDPFPMIEQYGVDALRYYLLRDIPFGSDGLYTDENFLSRFNSDLANDLGNVVSRVTAMVQQYFGGVLPAPEAKETDSDKELKGMAEGLLAAVSAEMELPQPPKALEEIFRVLAKANKYIEENTPWTLAKDEAQKGRLGTVLYNLIETIRIAAVILQPFLTETPAKIFERLGVDDGLKTFESIKTFGGILPGTLITKGDALFPRIVNK